MAVEAGFESSFKLGRVFFLGVRPRQGCEAPSFIDLVVLCISRGELAVNNVGSWDDEVRLKRCTLLAGKRC